VGRGTRQWETIDELTRPHILLLGASVGAGHDSNCSAIASFVAQLRPDARVTTLDYIGEFVGAKAAERGRRQYLRAVCCAPRLYGLYHAVPGRIPPRSVLQRFINRGGQEAFREYYQRERPDVILCNYPAAGGACGELRRRGEIECPVVTMVGDYDINNQWVHPYNDLTLASAEFVAQGMVERGLDPQRVVTTGLCIRPQFTEDLDRMSLRRKWGVPADARVVLILPGAFGMMGGLGEVFGAVERLPGLHALIVAGHSQSVREWFTARVVGQEDRLRVLGFITDMHELMALADLCITKAGGATCTEAIALRLPMVIHRPIPGQEGANARYAVENGVGVVTRNGRELSRTLEWLAGDAEALERMRQCAERIRRPLAARHVAEVLLALAEGTPVSGAARELCPQTIQPSCS